MPRRAGFTMIELLVVIGVIALLLAITFPAYVSIRRSQRIKRTQQVVGTLAAAAAAYANDYGMYPPAEYGSETANWGNRSLVTLLNARGGRSWPYLPSAFYDDRQEIDGPLFLDEWDREGRDEPYLYHRGQHRGQPRPGRRRLLQLRPLPDLVGRPQRAE